MVRTGIASRARAAGRGGLASSGAVEAAGRAWGFHITFKTVIAGGTGELGLACAVEPSRTGHTRALPGLVLILRQRAGRGRR